MKKIILSFGSVVVTAAPITTIIACGKKDDSSAFDFTKDLGLIVNETSTKTKADLDKDIAAKAADDAITADKLGYTEPTLSIGVIATYKVKTAYDNTTGVVEVTVTLTKGTETTTKDIKITATPFDLTAELDKVEDTTSTKTVDQLASDIATKAADTEVTAAELGITDLTLSNGVTVKYALKTVWDGVANTISVTATLTKGTETDTKDITITAAATPFDLTAELDKVEDTTSTKTVDQLASDIATKAADTEVTAAELGITDLTLSNGVTVKYALKTVWDGVANTISVTATLTKGTETDTKDITITAAANPFDFTADLAKVEDTTSTKTVDQLASDIATKAADTEVTAAELGITDLTLSNGVTVKYALKTVWDGVANTISVTATLTKGTETDTKDITITAAANPFDFTADLAKVEDTTSTKTVDQLASDIATKAADTEVTAAELGITDPTLSNGVTVKYALKTVWDGVANTISVTATLTKGTETDTKDITITAAANPFDFTADLAKVEDTTSTKTVDQLASDIATKAADTEVTAAELGITDLTLSNGVTVKYALKTVWDGVANTISVTATLTKGTETDTKDITITAAANPFDFTADLAKVEDTTSTKTVDQLASDIATKAADTEVTAAELGITDLTLSNGVTVKYALKTVWDGVANTISVTATLTKGTETDTKDITITAAANPFDFTADLAKVEDTTSTKTVDQLASDIATKAADTEVTAAELGITDPTLSNGVTVKYALKTVWDGVANTISVTATLTKGTETDTKDITITAAANPFDFTADLAKVEDTTSTKTVDQLASDIATKAADTEVTAAELGITDPTLSNGVTVKYALKTVWDGVANTISVTATLTKGTETDTKDITITAAANPFDFTADLAKVEDTTSTKTVDQLASDIATKAADTEVTAAELGITDPTLSNGVTVKYALKTVWDGVANTISVTATLTKGTETDTKDITITAAANPFDFTADLAKVEDTTSTKTVDQLASDIATKAADTEVTAAELGITDPTLSNGVTVKYALKTVWDGVANTISVTATLTKGTETDTKDITITAAANPFDFTADLAKVEDTTSTKTVDQLASDIATKAADTEVTAAELGITDLTLSNGVTVKYALKTVWDGVANTISVTATLTKGTETDTKDITITAK